ncbi:MAG: hypothetical protein WC627_11570 [Legionella sp.]|jgi:hypothetical protein
MKGIILVVIGFVLSGCTYYDHNIIEYRSSSFIPVSPVVTTVGYKPYPYPYRIQNPLDVTLTTIDFY